MMMMIHAIIKYQIIDSYLISIVDTFGKHH